MKSIDSVPIEVNGEIFQSLILSGISVNIHKYHSHPKFISYLANVAQMLNYFTLILYICHGTPVCDLSAPVRLLRPLVLVTVAPPFLSLLVLGCGITAYRRHQETDNDVLGTSPVTSYGYRSDVTVPFRTL